jgi:amidase
VPRTGHITSFDMAALDSLTQLGPMARYVEDLSLTLPIIAGVDWRDPSVIPMPLGQPDQIELKGLWAALYSDNGVASPTPDTVEVVQQAAKTLANCGMHVVEDRPPDLDLPAQLWFELFRADGGAKILALLAQAGTTQMHPSLQWILDGRLLSAAEFADLLARWVQFCSHMLAFLEKYDAILCPAAPEPAPPHGKVVAHHYSYVEPYNLTGWPAVVVRAGTSAQGLPIGVQIVARPWREDVALAVAQRLEAALGGWRPPVL